MDGLIKFFRQMKAFVLNLSPGRRIAFFLVLALVIGGLAALLTWTNRTNYRVVCSDLDLQDAGVVADALKKAKIPYRLEAGGTRILVPAERLDEARLKLSGQGLPLGGNVGFELFDQPKLGMSEYLQRLNFRRALQGELSRTISQLEEVRSARVHIVIPEQRLFTESQLPATASVVLKFKRGARLSPKQVQGVVNLVANSVEGLRPENVTVVDTSGNVLYGGIEKSSSAMLTESQQELKARIEADLRQKVQNILEQTVGKGKVRVQVDATLRGRETRETKEIFDPERSAVRSEQSRKEETIGSETAPGGVPGVKPNVQGIAGTEGAQTRNISRKSSETINYEITRIVQNVVEPPGALEKLSVAVLVDGTYRKQTGADGKEVLAYVPRSAEELAKYKEIVQNAVGFDSTRGDRISVINLPFQQEKESPEEEAWARSLERKRFWAPFIRYGIMLALVSLVILFVVRPLLKMIAAAQPPAAEEAKLLAEEERARIEGGERVPQIEETPQKEDPLEKVREIAAEDPERMARMIRAWVR